MIDKVVRICTTLKSLELVILMKQSYYNLSCDKNAHNLMQNVVKRCSNPNTNTERHTKSHMEVAPPPKNSYLVAP